jgi:hypothetical protein
VPHSCNPGLWRAVILPPPHTQAVLLILEGYPPMVVSAQNVPCQSTYLLLPAGEQPRRKRVSRVRPARSRSRVCRSTRSGGRSPQEGAIRHAASNLGVASAAGD